MTLLGSTMAHAQAAKPKGVDFTVRSEALPQGGKTLKWGVVGLAAVEGLSPR